MRISFLMITFVLASVGIESGCERPPHVELPPERIAEESEESEARPCRIDTDCDGYYRCMDQKCGQPPAMTGEVAADTPRVIFRDQESRVLAQFHLELALTREEQSRGLMYRDEMLDEWGMLFIYEEEDLLSFWMKNTLIPLDMIFIDDAGIVVGVVKEAEPLTRTPRSVGAPSRYVLEVNGGLAERYGIGPGATMSLHHVEDHHQPRH